MTGSGPVIPNFGNASRCVTENHWFCPSWVSQNWHGTLELALAAPAILAGLRIASVSTVSIATVAAFVIPQGLGRPIFVALGSNVFKTEIIAAGGLTIALALSVDAAFTLVQRLLTPWARRRAT